MTATVVYSNLQMLLTVFTEVMSEHVTGQALPLIELLSLLQAYGKRHLSPPRGDYIGMAIPVMSLFDALQKVQVASDSFYRTLNEMQIGSPDGNSSDS